MPCFGFLNMLLIGLLLGCQVLIFEYVTDWPFAGLSSADF